MAEIAKCKLDFVGEQEVRWDWEALTQQVNDEVKEDEICRACSMHVAKRNSCNALVGKPEGKRPLEILKLWVGG
jgi:hypothetical protein